MAALKFWWHEGAHVDTRYQPTPLLSEPALGFGTLTVDAVTPAETPPAPAGVFVVALTHSGAILYKILGPGQMGDALDADAKPLQASSAYISTIAIPPGYRLSVVESASP